MGFIGAKVSNPEILEWLKSKENQSQIIKDALNEKRLREVLGTVIEEPKTPQFKLKRVIA